MAQGIQTAIVTGASKGIGAAIAKRLAKDGFAVVINYSQSAKKAETIVSEIQKKGGRAIAVQADVSNADSMRKLFKQAETEFGNLQVVVNNAGVMQLAPIATMEDDAFNKMVDTNFKGVFNGMREAAQRLPQGGRIISFSSSVVGVYGSGYGIYGATKAAVEAMTHVLAKELGPKKINVNTIAPGPVETEMFFDGKSNEQLAAIRQSIPFNRLGRPEEIADVVSFLAGPSSTWINGQIIRVNGGMI